MGFWSNLATAAISGVLGVWTMLGLVQPQEGGETPPGDPMTPPGDPIDPIDPIDTVIDVITNFDPAPFMADYGIYLILGITAILLFIALRRP